MITIYKNTPAGLRAVEAVVPNVWANVVNPDLEEVARLREELHIPESFISASLDADELARIDREGDILLVIILVPRTYSDTTDVPYDTVTLGIIITPEYLVTICRSELPFIEHLGERTMKPVSTAKRNRLVLQILFLTAQTYLAYLRRIDTITDGIQIKLQSSMKNRELLNLLRYQKSLTYFRTGLESNRLMMRRLQSSQFFEAYPEDLDLLEDVLVETEQAVEMTRLSSDILMQSLDTFASIINNNLNDVMKILAVATIILSVPTVMASLYGMNVALPGMNHPLTFWLILLAALIAGTSLVLFFWRRDWL